MPQPSQLEAGRARKLAARGVRTWRSKEMRATQARLTKGGLRAFKFARLKARSEKDAFTSSMGDTLGVSAFAPGSATESESSASIRADLVSRAIDYTAKDAQRVFGFITPTLVREFGEKGLAVIKPHWAPWVRKPLQRRDQRRPHAPP